MLGDTTIRLGDKPVVLKCTLESAMAVDQNLGGIIAALRQVSAGNLTSIADIIAAGSGMDALAARQAVFQEGVAGLIGPITDYVVMLSTGGKKPAGKKEDKGDGEGER